MNPDPHLPTGKPKTLQIAQIQHGAWLAFCDPDCLQTWVDAAPGRSLATTAPATVGPPWTMYCATCSKRCWQGPSDAPGPEDDGPAWWIAGAQAAAFAAELGRHNLDELPPDAYKRAQRLCAVGLDPVYVARLIVHTHRP